MAKSKGKLTLKMGRHGDFNMSLCRQKAADLGAMLLSYANAAARQEDLSLTIRIME